jgi:hypothetical protein
VVKKGVQETAFNLAVTFFVISSTSSFVGGFNYGEQKMVDWGEVRSIWWVDDLAIVMAE